MTMQRGTDARQQPAGGEDSLPADRRLDDRHDRVGHGGLRASHARAPAVVLQCKGIA